MCHGVASLAGFIFLWRAGSSDMSNKPSPIKLAIIAAHPSELVPFVKMGRRHLIVKKNMALLAAGVGPVASTFGLTHFLEDYRPEHIIAVGTAGIINPEKLAIGDVVVAKSASMESGFSECYTPKLQISRVTHPSALPLAIRERVVMAHVFSPQEITVSPDWQKKFLQSNFDVEHLESFAFAFVAKKFRVPITIILGLTNVIDSRAHVDWLKNRKALVTKVGKIAAAII